MKEAGGKYVGACRGSMGGWGDGFARRGDVGTAVSAGVRTVRSGGWLKEGEELAGGARRAMAQVGNGQRR
jgi:hypothetical protein